MHIQYVGNFTQRHCTENHLALTLEDMGHTVERVQEGQTSAEDFTRLVAETKADLFLFTRTWNNTVTLEHLKQFKQRGIPTASYHLDLYVGLKRESGLDDDPFWLTDYVFTPDGSMQANDVFKAKGINHHYIKPAVYKGECYLAEPSQEFINDRETDVVFIGGGDAEGKTEQYGHDEWPYRGKLIKWLQDTYGERFAKYGYPQETIRNELLNYQLAVSKVVVGDSLCLNFDHPYYWSDRVYETMGRGGFIIHPFIEGMDEEFTQGKNIVFYKYGDFDQLRSYIDYYIGDNEEREKIRLAGHEYVKANCTYHNRLAQALEIVGLS